MSPITAFLLLLGTASAHSENSNHQPGGFTSLSESVLKRSADALVPTLVQKIKGLVIPGVNKSFFSIDPIKFEDVSIRSYDVSVVAGSGVKVTLQNMSNVIAHTNIMVDVKLLKCTGQIWATASGASYTAMNTIVVDGHGNGKLQTVTPPGGFDAGTIEVHHKMNGFFCEAAADVLHLVDSALIDLLTKALGDHLASIVAKAVDVPADLLLREIEKPPALGFGKEKFYLDNSYLDVNYDGQRITHLHKSEFKSSLHPTESKLKPPSMAASGERDIQFGFSDYVVNTLFDAMFAEHIGEAMIKVPFIKTIFDKECPKCPIALKTTFSKPARQVFADDLASAHITGLTMDIGAVTNSSKVLPMVTLSVNASAGVTFSLEKTEFSSEMKAALSPYLILPPIPLARTKSSWAVKAVLTPGDFQQELLISHIGKIDMSDLTRDVKALLKSVFADLNAHLPTLPLPSFGPVNFGKPAFKIEKRHLLLEADLEISEESPVVIIV